MKSLHNFIVAPIRRFQRDILKTGPLTVFPYTKRCPQCKKDNA